MSGIRFTWQCMECGRTFRTTKAAERAALDGCPNCGGVDIDIATIPGRAADHTLEAAARLADLGMQTHPWGTSGTEGGDNG